MPVGWAGESLHATLLVAFDGGGCLALAHLRGLFVELPAVDFGKDPGFFTGTLETAQRYIEGFIVPDFD